MSEHSERILAALEGGDEASALTASWRRCLALHGVDPDRAIPPEHDLRRWREALERDAVMVEVATSSLDELFCLLAGADCGVFLADRDGLILDLRTNRLNDPWHRSPDQWLGTIYSERLLGTNGVGTCIAEERGVIIRGAQHYLARYAQRICIGAPLFGPLGDLCGCLVINQDIAAHDPRLDAFLSISVGNFARRIEAELFARAHPTARLVLASPLGRRPAALLAVDRDDCVIGATRAARRLLDLTADAIEGACNVEEVLTRQAASGAQELAVVERRTIERALARTGGNISATAKRVGISRSTLYRKMEVYQLQR